MHHRRPHAPRRDPRPKDEEEEEFIERIAREIISQNGLKREHLYPKGRVDSTLFCKLRGFVTPRLKTMPWHKLAQLICYGEGFGVDLGRVMNAARSTAHKPAIAPEHERTTEYETNKDPDPERTTMHEVHGHAQDWIPPNLDGRSYLELIACTAVIACIHDRLKGDRKVLAPVERARSTLN